MIIIHNVIFSLTQKKERKKYENKKYCMEKWQIIFWVSHGLKLQFLKEFKVRGVREVDK